MRRKVKEKQENIRIKNNYKGITLIALVITIVVLLILASVSIAMLTGDNGIIGNANKAKEETEISNEKEIIDKSVIMAMGDNSRGNLIEKEFQNKLDREAGEGKTEVTDVGEEFEVIFKESNRYYMVDKDGNITSSQEIVEDKNPGDITIGENGEKLDGSAEHPYEIWNIEDLVALSNMANGTGIKIENGVAVEIKSPYNFYDKYFILKRDLNFNSNMSYSDPNRIDFGDTNGDGKVENIKTELTSRDEGCIGFRKIGVEFAGNFDGNNHSIKNIYQYSVKDSVALFGKNMGTIKNLNLTGTIICKEWHASGIATENLNKIINCKNYANVKGYNMVAGIVARTEKRQNSIAEIVDCINYGNLEITGMAYSYGGVAGIVSSSGNTIIKNCINEGNMIGTVSNGGIVASTSRTKIINCINNGNAKAGIADRVSGEENYIINCSNFGKCTCGIVNYITGGNWDNIIELDIKNCYNLGEASNAGIVGAQGTLAKTITLNIENCYNAGKSEKAIIGKIEKSVQTETITNIKNVYYDSTVVSDVGATSDGINAISNIKNNMELVNALNNNIGNNVEWKKWKMGEKGYPTFE